MSLENLRTPPGHATSRCRTSSFSASSSFGADSIPVLICGGRSAALPQPVASSAAAAWCDRCGAQLLLVGSGALGADLRHRCDQAVVVRRPRCKRALACASIRDVDIVGDPRGAALKARSRLAEYAGILASASATFRPCSADACRRWAPEPMERLSVVDPSGRELFDLAERVVHGTGAATFARRRSRDGLIGRPAWREQTADRALFRPTRTRCRSAPRRRRSSPAAALDPRVCTSGRLTRASQKIRAAPLRP